MFDHLKGEWVSVASEVPAYAVGKDCVRFQEDGHIEYSVEHEGRMLKVEFVAEKNGEEYILRSANGFMAGEPLRIKIYKIKENEIGVARIGMTTVYRRKTEPNQALQTMTTAVTDCAAHTPRQAQACLI
jgi:hypothetical protein